MLRYQTQEPSNPPNIGDQRWLRRRVQFKVEHSSYNHQRHFAIFCQLNVTPLPPPLTNPPRWNMRKANWSSFRESLEKQLEGTTPPEDLDQHEEFLTNTFHAAADEAIPRSKPPKKQRKDHWFYDQRVRVLNNRLNAACRLYRRHYFEGLFTTLAKKRRASKSKS
ncbi:hypothetical protein Pcinc_000793 [Petrolisthes cinctipes]|uniref:Uncharacterized protein n=1 Tax=Petrolisthes cinctipes TaxID=88211 RepID=A0AAE1GP13_PETCI|nr:hypothetical protein Pcinc_000793 [Petrolisthes cinctipes]